MRFLILHYHIFKNAGTTVENLLQKSFPLSFARFEGDGRDAQLSAAELLEFVREHPELQAISSHHLRYPRPSAPGFVFFDLLFLRDPIDRLAFDLHLLPAGRSLRRPVEPAGARVGPARLLQ